MDKIVSEVVGYLDGDVDDDDLGFINTEMEKLLNITKKGSKLVFDENTNTTKSAYETFKQRYKTEEGEDFVDDLDSVKGQDIGITTDDNKMKDAYNKVITTLRILGEIFKFKGTDVK